MSSMETREVNGQTRYRVRYRHLGRNLAVTFVTEAGALQWRKVLDELGHDAASKAIPTIAPDLSALAGSIIPTPGRRVDPFGFFVYMLWGEDPNRPVYVGATTNLPARIGRHTRERAGLFRTYSAIRCKDEAGMWRVETRLISHYRPELNIVSGRSEMSA